MKPINITSSFSNREKMRRNPFRRTGIGYLVEAVATNIRKAVTMV
jgi:hypothetical protein